MQRAKIILAFYAFTHYIISHIPNPPPGAVMKKLIFIVVFTFLPFSASLLAADYSAPDTDPRGIREEMLNPPTDRYWEVLRTIPCASPGSNNAWVGSAWANDELILCKNIAGSTSHPQFLRINPQTGAILATVNFPFTGYIVGCTFDGTNLWVVQWSPVNVVHRLNLAGVELSSFSPNVGRYSARSVAWDGTDLLIGCNHSANNTKLVKFTTTGTVLQTWSTDSVVGWYMDSDMNLAEPPGVNYYVADNISNSIKRLSIGTTITIVTEGGIPGINELAEGLACSVEGLWANGAYAILGVIWELSYGYIGPPLFLHVTLTPVNPPIVIPAQGGSCQFNVSTFNQGPLQGPYWIWTRDKYPDGSYTNPLLGPVQINPPLGVNITRLRLQNVPASLPAGVHTYLGYANVLVNYPAYDSSFFTWTKSATTDGGSWMTDASSTDELFPGEVPPPFLKRGGGDNSLVTASPNPFNPTATIRFELRATSFVSLKIYDTTGRLVSTLVDGWREAGTHEVFFDGTDLASGLYLYNLNAGNQTFTGKMTLLK